MRATADLHVALAELDRELGDLTSAEEHLETARVLAERTSITENRHRWFVAMSQVRTAVGDHAAATRLLDRAAELYRHGFYPDVRPIAAMKARVQIAGGDLAAAGSGPTSAASASMHDPDYLREYEHLTLARLLIARRPRRTAHRSSPRYVGDGRAGAARPTARRGDRSRAAGSMLRDPRGRRPSPTTPTVTCPRHWLRWATP